jgi:hypothetical protein
METTRTFRSGEAVTKEASRSSSAPSPKARSGMTSPVFMYFPVATSRQRVMSDRAIDGRMSARGIGE